MGPEAEQKMNARQVVSWTARTGRGTIHPPHITVSRRPPDHPAQDGPARGHRGSRATGQFLAGRSRWRPPAPERVRSSPGVSTRGAISSWSFAREGRWPMRSGPAPPSMGGGGPRRATGPGCGRPISPTSFTGTEAGERPVRADGTPKVSDLGLAKRLSEAGALARGLTLTGVVLGTPSYMAPEQARGTPGVPGRQQTSTPSVPFSTGNDRSATISRSDCRRTIRQQSRTTRCGLSGRSRNLRT